MRTVYVLAKTSSTRLALHHMLQQGEEALTPEDTPTNRTLLMPEPLFHAVDIESKKALPWDKSCHIIASRNEWDRKELKTSGLHFIYWLESGVSPKEVCKTIIVMANLKEGGFL